MGYKITTIAQTLQRINQDLFIPAIQRPYVWQQEQITRLFDSLMRGYPIGALMFWDLPEGSEKDWEIYRFVTDFRMGSIHNDKVEVEQGQPVSLVLDGQQRLTSLLIGLQGSYTVKRKHKRTKSDDAWDEKTLYIDLAHSPNVEADQESQDDEISPIAEHYRFDFFDRAEQPKNRKGELWFEVALILTAPNAETLAALLRPCVDANMNLAEQQREVARTNLERLWQAIWQDHSISFFTECSASYDRVLDIFIRANDGGTRLSRSDLLMSVITLRWEAFNAREETEALIDDLTNTLQPKRVITREFILRTALFLNDLDFSIKVQNFVPSNIRLLEQSWERIKETLRFTAQLLSDNGLFGDRLSGINIVMLVAYYVHKRNSSIGSPSLAPEDYQLIRKWVILMSFQGLLGVQTNNTFKSFRSAVQKARASEPLFPWESIAESLKTLGRPIEFSPESINRWCNVDLANHAQAELLLSLLYEDDLLSLQRRAVPLVQERYLTREELRRAGVSDGLAPVIQGYTDKLILGVALNQGELDLYHTLPFEQWAQTLSPAFLTKHCLPESIALYRLENLPEWVSERRKLLSQKLMNLMANSCVSDTMAAMA